MTFHKIIFILSLLFLLSCKKDKNVFQGGTSSTPEYVFTCDSSLTQPVIGWQDTIGDADKAVQKVLYNPINSNEVIYIVKSKNYFSEMYIYNKQTKIAKSIDKSIYTMPSISKFGWLTYCKANFCIYKIKANGDSLTQLSNSFSNFPRWDYTGNRIFYTQESSGSSPARLMIMNNFGTKLDSVNGFDGILGISTKSNKIVSINSTTQQLFIKDLTTGNITNLRHGSYNYYNLTIDNKDENIFWWDNKGIYKLNISSLNVDTIVKICPLKHFLDTPSFDLYATNVSPNSNKLTFTLVTNKAVNWPKLFHEYKALEMDLLNNKITEIKLFQ